MEIWLSVSSSYKIMIPVNPESIGYEDSSNFEDIVMASGDEKTVISGRNLKTFSISSFFPKNRVYYRAGNVFAEPMYYVDVIQKWMDEKRVIRLQATTTNINHQVTIRTFKWEEKGGAVGDIEYTIELKEHKPISYSVIKPAAAQTGSDGNRPPTEKDKPKTHTVKSGESLWVISTKYYGTGTKLEAIYERNKAIIGPNKNLIKPGQKLVLP